MEAKVITDTLRKCELFSDLSDEELSSIAELCRVEKYDAGDIIYEQNSLGIKLYVLYSTDGLFLLDGYVLQLIEIVSTQSHILVLFIFDLQ